MKFHFNEVALRHTAQSRLPDREGRLQYRSSKGGYKERWFRLQGNLLFYFRTNEFGSIADHDPLGVFVLAQFSVELEQISDRPFVFTITFAGEEGRKHYFSGQTIQQCHEWMDALHRNSYEALRMKFESIRREVQHLTGKDPITEKVATSLKQKVKTSMGSLSGSGQDSRRTKFYYGESVSSKSDVTAASAVPTEKPVHRQEASKTKLVGMLDSKSTQSSNVILPLQEKPQVEEVLVSLSLEGSSVQKNSIQPSINRIPQTTTQEQVFPLGISDMPLVQLDVSQMPTPQSGISNVQHEQFGNTTHMPGISRMLLGKSVTSQMPLMQPGISQPVLFRPGISQMPLLQSGMSVMPPTLSEISQVPTLQPLNMQMPLVQPGNSQMRTAQSGISKMPLMHPGSSHTPLVPYSGMPLLQPDTTSMPVTKMQMPSTMRPRSAQTSEMHNRSAMHRSQTSSDERFQMLQSDTLHISEPNAASCWPLHPLQRTGKSHTTPELTSFEKWEKFDE